MTMFGSQTKKELQKEKAYDLLKQLRILVGGKMLFLDTRQQKSRDKSRAVVWTRTVCPE